MANKLQNILDLFRNSRTRTIILGTASIVLVILTVNLLRFFKSDSLPSDSSGLQRTPDIRSIPGGMQTKPSKEYQQLQQQQNIQKFQEAERSGTSAIPTIVDAASLPASPMQGGGIMQGRRGEDGSQPTSGTTAQIVLPCNPCCENVLRTPCLDKSGGVAIPPLHASKLTQGTLVYDTGKNVIGRVGVDGSVYDKSGKLIGHVGPDGLIRDAQGNVIGSAGVAASGFGVYDGAGHLLGWVRPDGSVHDSRGRKIGQVDADGSVRSLSCAIIGRARIIPRQGNLVYSFQGPFLGTASIDGKAWDLKGRLLGRVGGDGIVYDEIKGLAIGSVSDPLMYNTPVYARSQLLGHVGLDSKTRDFSGKVIGFAGKDGIVRSEAGTPIGKTGIYLAGAAVYNAHGDTIGEIGPSGEVRNNAGKLIGKWTSIGIRPLVDSTTRSDSNIDDLKVGHDVPLYDALLNKRLGVMGQAGKARDIDGKPMKATVDPNGILLMLDLKNRVLGKTAVNLAGASVYGVAGKQIGTVDSDGTVRDSAGKALGIINDIGFLRDSRGQIIGSTNPKFGRRFLAIPGSPVYDEQGNLIATVGSDGKAYTTECKIFGTVGIDEFVRSATTGEIVGKIGNTAPGIPLYNQEGNLIGTAIGPKGLMLNSQGCEIARLLDNIARDKQGNRIGSTQAPIPANRTKQDLDKDFSLGSGVDRNADLKAVRRRQEAEIAAQNLGQLRTQMQGSISTQISSLISTWSNVPTQQYEEGPLAAGQKESATQEILNNLEKQATKPASIRAGTIMQAVLITAVNTDEPGPILARIVSEGPLHGAKLLGSVTSFEEKAVLRFTSLVSEKLPQTTAIDAVAVDPNTSRTAISSYTDQHKILKWGGLFASSFLEGLGKSVSEAAKVEEEDPKGNTKGFNKLWDKPWLIPVAALGPVGQKFSSVLVQKASSVRPTVHIYAGTAVGILFTHDIMSLGGMHLGGMHLAK